MVEGARLESVYRVTPIGGSNPPLSVFSAFVLTQKSQFLAPSSDGEDRGIIGPGTAGF